MNLGLVPDLLFFFSGSLSRQDNVFVTPGQIKGPELLNLVGSSENLTRYCLH